MTPAQPVPVPALAAGEAAIAGKVNAIEGAVQEEGSGADLLTPPLAAGFGDVEPEKGDERIYGSKSPVKAEESDSARKTVVAESQSVGASTGGGEGEAEGAVVVAKDIKESVEEHTDPLRRHR